MLSWNRRHPTGVSYDKNQLHAYTTSRQQLLHTSWLAKMGYTVGTSAADGEMAAGSAACAYWGND
jgi:hypothetical protein